MGRQTSQRPPNPLDDGPMMKMKELVEATGVSKATILYYISLKLLPSPVKTGRNVAFYPSSFVDRILLIRQLQSQHRFSLSQIRTILDQKDRGRNVETLIEFNKEVYTLEKNPEFDRKTFCSKSGLTEGQLKKAIDMELIIPVSKDRFDTTDLLVAQTLSKSLAGGNEMEELGFYPDMISSMVDQELALRKKLIEGLGYDEALSRTLEATKLARLFREYITERIFQKKASRQPLVTRKETN